MTVTVRTRFQPTLELEVDENEAKALEHQGLLWAGTDKELAALHDEAEHGTAPVADAPTKTTPAANAAATNRKEGA